MIEVRLIQGLLLSFLFSKYTECPLKDFWKKQLSERQSHFFQNFFLYPGHEIVTLPPNSAVIDLRSTSGANFGNFCKAEKIPAELLASSKSFPYLFTTSNITGPGQGT